MPQAISRLLLISILTIIGIGFAGLMLRIIGLSAEYAVPDHPFLRVQHPIVVLGGDEGFAPSNSLPALEHVFTLNKPDSTFVLGLDLNRTLDGEWILFRDDRLETLTEGSGFIELKTWDEIKNLTLGKELWNGQHLHILRLVDVLEKYPTQFLFLNILVRYPDRMNELVRILDKDNQISRFIIQSPFATAIREIRKSRPLWLYGIDPSSVVRFLMMNSLYLEPLADLKADLFVASLQMGDETVFSPRVLQELDRRRKSILLDQTKDKEHIPSSMTPKIFGVITRHP